MKARLLFADGDFDPERADRPGDEDLVRDLDLATLVAAAGDGDAVVRASVRTALLAPLTDPARIGYRQDAFADCRNHPAVVHDLYELATQVASEERKTFRATFFSHSSGALLHRSVTVVRMFAVALHRLRAIADEHAAGFASAAFVRFFAEVRTDLDEEFLAEVAEHLDTLRFRDGVVAGARLGRQSQGIDYVLRKPATQHLAGRLLRRPAVEGPAHSRRIDREDRAGREDLAGLQDRILDLAADSLARVAQHVLDFFVALRAEIAFYLGCLRLHERLTGDLGGTCRAEPRPLGTGVLSARGLYDPALALRLPTPVQPNDLAADGRPLIVVTGANQGGKSTFLRSVGAAQLMMQAGMPVAAAAFTASTVGAVFTHFARDEDAGRAGGLFDDQLRRMSEIAHRMRPPALLLANESFAGTNEREASDIAADVLLAMTGSGVTVVLVTHLYDLADRFRRDHADATLFLRAVRLEDGRRTFRLVIAPAQATGFAADLFRRTFGPAPAEINDVAQRPVAADRGGAP